MSRIKLGRNEPCWCGSGEKFKKCHLRRESESRLPIQAIAIQQQKAATHSTCLHPEASSANCGKIISAHTLQRARVLKSIADSKNHVLSFFPLKLNRAGEMQIHNRGWHDASTFTAFCEHHDAKTFSDLETREFSGSLQQCFLIAYRAICWELHQKLRAEKSIPTLRTLLDRGATEDIQIEIQRSLSIGQAGRQKGLKDLQRIKIQMDEALRSGDFSSYRTCELIFEPPMHIAATGAITPNRTISGRHLQTLHDPNVEISWLSFGVDISPRGVSVVFIWRKDEAPSVGYMEEILKLKESELSKFVLQFLFAHCENTYFSQSWWNQQSSEDRMFLTELMGNTNPYYFPPAYRFDRDISFGNIVSIRI